MDANTLTEHHYADCYQSTKSESRNLITVSGYKTREKSKVRKRKEKKKALKKKR